MEERTDIPESHKFPKKERLNSKKLIDALFNGGAFFHSYPFTVKYLPNPSLDADCHQVMVSVAKRRFKKAVDRNRIKRLIKEAYRLNKSEYLTAPIDGKFLLIVYIYTAKEIHSFSKINNKLIESLMRLSAKQE